MILLLSRLYRAEKTIVGRLKSQQLLEEALSAFPEDLRIHLELGKTYYEQTFYPDAERCFYMALGDETTACDAHHCLAVNYFRKWKRNQQFTDELERAADHYEEATGCAPADLTWAIERAMCCYCLGDTSLSAELCKEIISQDPTVTKALFILGVIAYGQHRYEESEQAFRQALLHLPEEEMETFLDIAILLPTAERIEYEQASKADRLRMRKLFWFARDPDPTTPVNERYLEHIGRMFLADLHYSTDQPRLRGWETQRGKAIIKFGWPSRINRTLARVTTNVIDGWAEFWTYGAEVGDWQLVFVDEFLNGNSIVPREPAYEHMAQMLVNSAASSSYEPGAVDIPGAFDIVSFRNNTLSGAVYLAARVDADSLLRSLKSDALESYLIRGVFFDSSWNERMRFADTLSGPDLMPIGELDDKWLYAIKDVQLPFDQYQVSCALEDPFGETRRIFKGTVTSRRFLSDSLTLSDVLVYRDQKSHPDAPSFERNGRTFVPNPGHLIEEGERLSVYFEIYNLVQYQSSSEYEVSYTIFEHPEELEEGGWLWLARGLKWLAGIEEQQTPSIIQTATRRSFETPANELMAINIDPLEAGRYILKVSVFDKFSGEVAAVSTVFTKGIWEIEPY